MSQTANLGENLRIIVTGGAGFIGSNFVRMWEMGHFSKIEHITVVDKLTYAGNLENLKDIKQSEKFRFIQGDISNYESMKNLFEGDKFDALINFAAESHVDRSILRAKEFVQTNIVGVQILLDLVRKNENMRFLQVSTDEIYGSIENGSWIESDPLLPNSPYSATKASAELIVRSYTKTYGINSIITRSSNNYGTHHNPEKLIPLFITNLLDKLKVPIYGDGLNVRDWLHVDDHCRGIYLALTKGKSGEIYNIGGGLELTNLELTQKIFSIFNITTSDEIRWVEDREGHDFRYSISSLKAQTELGYFPEKDFTLGLKETVEWYRTNEAWWRPLKHR